MVSVVAAPKVINNSKAFRECLEEEDCKGCRFFGHGKSCLFSLFFDSPNPWATGLGARGYQQATILR